MPSGPAVLRFVRGLPPTRQFGERARLLVIEGPDKGTCFSLLGDSIFIGREDCQIVLNDTNISRKHAELGWKESHFVLRDLGSANGTLLNGEKVKEAPLKIGDLLMIGLSVMEVYPPGQTRKNENPLLPAGVKIPSVADVEKKIPKAEPKEENKLNPEEVKKKRDTEKKRLLVFVAIFFIIFVVYFSEGEEKTIRENAKLESGEPENQKSKKKKKTKKEIEEALAEYIPNYTNDSQQRKDAEIFFRNGVRELQNKNYRRAFTAFETALTVDSTHDLAKIYLKTAKKEMLLELESIRAAALRAKKSLRYKESRMHYENIIRYLEGETGNNDFMDNESNKRIKKLFEEAEKSLKELDKEEKRIP